VTHPTRNELDEAVADWKRKHGIADDDPVLATVELWQIFLSHGSETDLRSSLQQLSQISKSVTKQSGEVIRELRSVPKLRDELWAFPYFAAVLIAVLAFITGMLVGRFLL
jgi:hypothetical protein